jgi:transcriptional regulator with XRE-family HTH domain
MLDAVRLRELREECGLSQADLALEIGMDRQYVWKLEHGVNTDVRASTLEKLANVLGCTTDELLGRKKRKAVAV